MSNESSIEVPRVNVLGVGISALDMPLAIEKILEGADRKGFAGFVTVTGVHGVMESHRDDELRRIHNRSYLSTPDGMPMVWMARWNGYDAVDRVYGPDLMLEVVLTSAGSGRRHFFWGGKEGVAKELGERMKNWFPGSEVAGSACPPFRELSPEEDVELVSRLQESEAALFLGRTEYAEARALHARFSCPSS